MDIWERLIVSVVLLIIGIIAGRYVIVPLLLYLGDTIAYLVVKSLNWLFPAEANFIKYPDDETIKGEYILYSPNPINYILSRVPITPKEFANYVENGRCHPCVKYSFDMAIYPVIKNTKNGLLRLVHRTGIIKRLTTKCK